MAFNVERRGCALHIVKWRGCILHISDSSISLVSESFVYDKSPGYRFKTNQAFLSDSRSYCLAGVDSSDLTGRIKFGVYGS